MRTTIRLNDDLLARQVTKLKTAGHGGLRPGVSLDSTAELLDIMDGSDRDYARFPGLRWRHPFA